MNKKEIVPSPEFFDRYINLVPEENIFEALDSSKSDIENLDLSHLKKIGDKVYAPNKWTIKDILQHIIDNERVQAYRALRFARKDATQLPGYDEQLFAQTSSANLRTLEELLEELKIVRLSTIALFKSFDNVSLQNSGVCFEINISVLALGYVIVGHQIHHFQIIKERYAHLA